MKNLKLHSLVLVAISFLISLNACTEKEQINVTGNPTPLIKLISISSKQLKQFKDSLVITIEYTDGDGDIGETNPDMDDLEIKDQRLSKPDYYFVKPLTPPNANIKVKGIIAVQIKNTFLLGTADSEITLYEIRLRDRAGNWSNTIKTEVITIIK
ncbi:MAG: hypothetical protein ACKVQB_03000 [Bacteroidia bacterium]